MSVMPIASVLLRCVSSLTVLPVEDTAQLPGLHRECQDRFQIGFHSQEDLWAPYPIAGSLTPFFTTQTVLDVAEIHMNRLWRPSSWFYSPFPADESLASQPPPDQSRKSSVWTGSSGTTTRTTSVNEYLEVPVAIFTCFGAQFGQLLDRASWIQRYVSTRSSCW